MRRRSRIALYAIALLTAASLMLTLGLVGLWVESKFAWDRVQRSHRVLRPRHFEAHQFSLNCSGGTVQVVYSRSRMISQDPSRDMIFPDSGHPVVAPHEGAEWTGFRRIGHSDLTASSSPAPQLFQRIGLS